MAYHSFIDPSGNAYGSFETFRVTRQNRPSWGDNGRDADGALIRCGFYWQACFPGCLPDGEPMGPFRSEAAAIRDARGEFLTRDDSRQEPVDPLPELCSRLLVHLALLYPLGYPTRLGIILGEISDHITDARRISETPQYRDPRTCYLWK